ncbi:MAG: M13 family peptidase [Chitinophagia bacterium]|nr:M13 family peptidase [Chitinophagia bacterium]
MRVIISSLLSVAAIILCQSCNGPASPAMATSNAKPDVLASHTDSTTSPATDFFQYANGGWFKKNPIPSDETSYGIGELVQRELSEKLRQINEEMEKKAATSGVEQQVGDFWHSAMDSAGIEGMGVKPLQPELDRINALKSAEEVMLQAAHMHAFGIGAFFEEGVSQDAKNSEMEAYYMNQGGLGMPNRDYYLKTDARTVGIRTAYLKHIAKTFILCGVDSVQAEKKATEVLKFETALAKASRKLEDLREPYKNYNKIAIINLNSIAPKTNWTLCLQTIGVKNLDSVIVGQPEFYTTLDKLVNTTPLPVLKDYLSFHLVNSLSEYLSTAFFNESFGFYRKTLRGQEQPRPRWRRALEYEHSAMGEAVGKLFVKEYFSQNAKKRYETLVVNVKNAYKTRMQQLTWMSSETKQKAINKLESITYKVGYPEHWRDYSSLKIDRGPLVLNMIRASQWFNNYQLNKLGKPVNRTEWDMTPQTYNAYYNPSNNEIVLPAAMMSVPGYKDEELDDALVYGYTAASTVGHEITHGFDDEGRKYDEKGNLHNWWVPQDSVEFVKRAQVLVKQFNGIIPIDTMHINGEATLGENLADLGGVLIGLDAFKQTDTYKKREKISGLTPLQRFFLGYSLGWLLEQRPERLANQLLVDVHSPAKYRVNGIFPNIPDFYTAFSIKPTDKMYIPDSMRVHLW